MLRIVYLECLFALYESGGSLSPDPEVLADVCMLPAAEIARCLPTLIQIGKAGRGGLYIEDGELRNRRATEDIAEEMEYRKSAREHGRRGGRPPLQDQKVALGDPKGTLSDPKGTPRAPARPHAPPPPPTPTPTPTPETHPPTQEARPSASRAREKHDLCPDQAGDGAASKHGDPPGPAGALPPSPRLARASPGNGSGWLPGEEQLADLAEALWTAHPTGVRGGTQVATQRALLKLLADGRIWPEEHPPNPPPPPGFGLSFGELRARHAAWLVVWRPRGRVPPMNLPLRWLARTEDGGGMDFLDLPPAQEGKAPPKEREWNPGVTAERLEKARAKMFRRPVRPVEPQEGGAG